MRMAFCSETTALLISELNGRFKMKEALTERGQKVMHLIFEEHSDGEIAGRLKVNPKTFSNDKKERKRKLEVTNLVGLIKYMMKNKLG